MTEDEMVGWHHRLNGHELEWAPGTGEGQEGRACRSPWGREESDTTEQQPSHMVLAVKNPPANARDGRDSGSILG